jgi:hypothetical protein
MIGWVVGAVACDPHSALTRFRPAQAIVGKSDGPLVGRQVARCLRGD